MGACRRIETSPGPQFKPCEPKEMWRDKGLGDFLCNAVS